MIAVPLDWLVVCVLVFMTGALAGSWCWLVSRQRVQGRRLPVTQRQTCQICTAVFASHTTADVLRCPRCGHWNSL